MPSVNWQSNYWTGLSLKNRPRFLAAQTATYYWQPTRLIPERGNDLASVCIMTFYLCTLVCTTGKVEVALRIAIGCQEGVERWSVLSYVIIYIDQQIRFTKSKLTQINCTANLQSFIVMHVCSKDLCIASKILQVFPWQNSNIFVFISSIHCDCQMLEILIISSELNSSDSVGHCHRKHES